MTLIDVLSAPWAIVPEKLRELQAIYATHLHGERIDLAAVEARLGRPLANDQKAYTVENGVATLEISGVISPKANMFTRISGGTAASMLVTQMQGMLADPKVRAVLLNFDSHGGNVLGIPAAADAIRVLAAEKPTVAVSTGTLASAAYWLASAANAVYIGGTTDFVGSIGVVATHAYDPRSADVQKTEITAGKYKRMVSDSSPLTAEGRAYLQAQVDQLYSVFVDAVAANRGASAEDVLNHMADGRIFIGQQAVDAGLADGIAGPDALVEQLAQDPSAFATRRRATFGASVKPPAPAPAPPSRSATASQAETIPGVHMTPQELAASFAAENPEAAALLRAEGSTAERDRIQAVRGQAMPGHDALIDKLAFDGRTTGPEAAVQVLAAERGRIAQLGAARAADAPDPVPQAPSQESPSAGPAVRTTHAGFAVDPASAKVDAQARVYMAAHPGVDYVSAVKAVHTQQGA